MNISYIYIIAFISIILSIISIYLFVYSPLFSLKAHARKRLDKLFLKENNLSTSDIKDLFLYILKLLDYEKIEHCESYIDNGVLLSKLKSESGHIFSVKSIVALTNLTYSYPPFEIEFYDEFSKCLYAITYKDLNVKISATIQNRNYTRSYTIDSSLSNKVYSNILLMNLLHCTVLNADLSSDNISTIVRNLNKNVRVGGKTIDKYI